LIKIAAGHVADALGGIGCPPSADVRQSSASLLDWEARALEG
jgi:hypothetical protein